MYSVTEKTVGRLLVGTSGWWYKDWVDRFYPTDLEKAGWLEYYASRFPTVELNASFYRLPFENMLRGFSRKVPEGFVFAAKGSRSITHARRLRDTRDLVQRYYERMRLLRGLEVVLWQLPPSLKQDVELLESFLSLLPGSPLAVVEFRHPSWWDHRTAAVLSRYGVGFCAVSHPRLPAEAFDTANFVYLRFHGLGKRLYDYDYSDDDMFPQVEIVVRALRQGKDVYAYFNNDYRANAIDNAKSFQAIVRRRLQ